MSFSVPFAAVQPAGSPAGLQQGMSPSVQLDGESGGPDYSRQEDQQRRPLGELQSQLNGHGSGGISLPPPGLESRLGGESQAIAGASATLASGPRGYGSAGCESVPVTAGPGRANTASVHVIAEQSGEMASSVHAISNGGLEQLGSVHAIGRNNGAPTASVPASTDGGRATMGSVLENAPAYNTNTCLGPLVGDDRALPIAPRSAIPSEERSRRMGQEQHDAMARDGSFQAPTMPANQMMGVSTDTERMRSGLPQNALVPSPLH
ncbi:unnamed protein product [Symbiodinium natans]|uniref:Uncharacterized protein n=1 Tax=Symbiodinium natans TaxID=878477 RepID=A0A812LMH2_9DINO|nr:unnamed protein product [Symbiodinium natans]